MKNLTKVLMLIGMVLGLTTFTAQAQSIDDNGVLKSWMNPPAKLKMPDNVVKVSDNCFCGKVDDGGWEIEYYPNPDITSVNFNKVQIIGKQAFYRLPKLTKVTSMDFVKEIMEQSFAECGELKSIKLPAIEILGKESLANCQFLESIHLGKNLKEIGDKPFKNCPELAHLTMDEGGEFFMVKDNVLISKQDGTIYGAASKISELNIPEAKVIGEYVFQNNTNISRVVMENLKEIKDGAFCGCSKLFDLRIPKLEKLPSWGPMTFNGCTSLRIVDVHESADFEGFKNCGIPNKKELTIYVANEEVKKRVESQLDKVSVVIGEPDSNINSYLIEYECSEGGIIDAWSSNIMNLESGTELVENTKVSFKAIPCAGYSLTKFIYNNKDVTDQLEMNYGAGTFTIEELSENVKIKAIFSRDEQKDMVYFKCLPSDAGTIKCTLDDGTEVKSATKIASNSHLNFTAKPTYEGFYTKVWKKDVGDNDFNYKEIPGTENKESYECFSEDGLDIQAIFSIKENHVIFIYKNQNQNSGTLKGYIEKREISNVGAYPINSKISLKMEPTDKKYDLIKWYEVTKDDFIELKEYRNHKTITIELTEGKNISAICTHEEKPEPGKNDPIIEGDHLVSWNAVGEVTIPKEVRHIDAFAFRGSMELEKVILNDNVKTIGEAAFCMCAELSEIEIPETNKHFKVIENVIYSKDGKTLVSYPGGKKEKSYTLPSEVERIIPGALITTPRIKTVNADSNANFEVLGGALVRKSDKTMVYFPNAGFMKAEEPELVLDKSIEHIGRFALAYIPALTKLKLHENILSIDACACMGAGGLRKIYFDDEVEPRITAINDSAFFYNMSLEEVPYMASLKKIGVEAFARDYNIKIAHVPAGCEIGDKAFDYALGLVNVYSHGTIPPVITETTFTNIQNIEEAILFVPEGCTEAYENAAGWNMFNNIREFNQAELAKVNVDLSKHYFATLYYEDRNLIVPEGVTVCTMHRDSSKDNGEKIGMKPGHIFQEGEIIQKGTAVVIFSKNKKIYTFEATPGEGTSDSENILFGKLDEKGMTSNGNGKYYKLSLNNGTYGFYAAKANAAPFKCEHHKAYMMIKK